MKKISIAAGAALALSFSTLTLASGYANDSAETVWRDGSGNCLRMDTWTESDQTADCATKTIEIPERTYKFVEKEQYSPGYVNQAETTIWKNSAGECWRNDAWSEEDQRHNVACGGTPAVAKPKPKPVVVEKPKPVVPVPQEPTATMVPAAEIVKIYFDYNSDRVNSVSNVVDAMNSMAVVNSVEVVGHADPTGSSAYNLRLSERRAQNVIEALRQVGVTGQIGSKAMGEQNPVTTCKGQRGSAYIQCLREDRRVDVTIRGQRKEMR